MSKRVRQAPERNLALELVRVTEASALAAARWQGRGDGQGAEQSAAAAMSVVLNSLQMNGTVVIGEGARGETQNLYPGQRVGTGEDPEADVAVDPVDGAMLLAQGRSDAVAVVATAERNTMFDPGPVSYMEKIVVGHEAAGVVDLDRPPVDNVEAVARAKGENVRDITVVILDRPRHSDLIAAIRSSGARIRLIQDGDVAAALAAITPGSGADMLYGIGGTGEGVISAAAVRCAGGEIQARLWARSREEKEKALGAGLDLEQIYLAADLVDSDNCFFAATGITDGQLMKGVQYEPDVVTTDSLVMRSKSGTVRRVQARHQLAKLAEFSEVDYA